ncbi:hypothetical protein [Sandaracinus amylolyticus]|uniref:Uncharacterized protein n=1 Tax=Sandaracinus amylolyticus TaxID=927083 RepID=A0A0F6YGJ6_9BACT|nr:hypothetical protein [Sandaracinus amylolyticus]AKF03760.1 Hypothetical protein DB32_000909 [Sandaracinus amylolyticus]
MRAITTRLALAAIVLASTLSCARTRTQVLVRVDADPWTLMRTTRVHVRVWNHEDEVRLDRVVRVQGDGAETMLPLTVPITPRDNDASRAWRAHVEAFDADSRKFNEVRAISTFVADRVFEVRLRLEDACIDRLTCPEDQTCHRGECRDAHVDPMPPVIPAGLGWHELDDTRLADVCDPAYGQCEFVVSSWSGATIDAEGARMFVWGGGGTGEYRGNQVFELELDTLTMRAIDAPIGVGATCEESDFRERPPPRATYDGLEWIPALQRMLAYGGAQWCNGMDAQLYDPATATWERVPVPAASMYPHVALAYDRDRGVIVSAPGSLWIFDPAVRALTRIADAPIDSFNVTATIDTRRRRFAAFGNGVYWELDLATNTISRPALTGCEAALAQPAPGFVYDSAGDQYVTWGGGDDVVLIDPETHVCTTLTFQDGPGPQVTQGTFGRFAYFPTHDVFVLVNAASQNVFALRLR